TTRRQYIAALLRVAVRRQTYLNLMYLVAAFPLGLFYFNFLIIGFSVGVGTAVVGVGIALLIFVVLAWWAFAKFERELVMWWLGVRIPPMSTPALPNATAWERFRGLLRNPVTWKSLAYLFAEFPFGIFSFVCTITALAVSLGLILSPVVYLTGTALHNSLGDQSTSTMGLGIAINGYVNPLSLALTVVLSVAGFFLLIGALYVLNGIAFAWGQFARIMLGMSDNTRRLAEARATAARERTRAERADQSRRELIVNVSHELRTPIANISGHVESLLMSDGQQTSEENAKHYLEIVARESERLSSLVDDLLALARADADELKLDVRPIPACAVVEEVYQSLAPLAKRDRQVTLVRSVEPELPQALADRDRLAQVLLNLVRNAITYTPPGGIVSISLVRADEAHLALTVADTGIGIPPEELDRIFDRFYRTDTSRTRASGGFGLGLSIVRDLVQAMGGTVSATSELGDGSQFRVVLRTASRRP
ncbi:MAG TPA: sensor domain-containing protein, partial [Ktedonobacterales bacterium]|nr:sensor domain-containing protein [Ktedonobacterales bacterium]